MSRRWRHLLFSFFPIIYQSANGTLLGGHLHGVKVLSTFLRLADRYSLGRVLIRLELV